MASFLLVEALFYLVHNVSGAPRGDLLTGASCSSWPPSSATSTP
ncbi:MAG: hypothetical protein ABWX85_00490 [Arthrobacter sp.]